MSTLRDAYGDYLRAGATPAAAGVLSPAFANGEVGLYLYWTGKLFADFYTWQTAKERLGLEPIDAEWVGPGRDMEYGKIVRPDTLALEGVLDDDDEPQYLTDALTGDARVL